MDPFDLRWITLWEEELCVNGARVFTKAFSRYGAPPPLPTAFSRSFSINGVFRVNGIVGVPLARSIAQGANQTRLRCAPKKTLLPSFPSSAPLMSFSSFLRGVRYFSHAASFIIITTNTSLAIHD